MPPDTGSPFPFSRKAIIEADGSRWINQIHRDDIATALSLLVESSARGIFNVTDDHPLPQREIYTWLAHRFARHGRAAQADLMEYIELKTELILRAEEIMLSADDNGQPGELATPLTPQPEDRAKFERLQALEAKLGKPLLRAIGPKLAFSRNDLWELQRFRARAFGG